jgi:CheY-like chemotaxis protein
MGNAQVDDLAVNRRILSTMMAKVRTIVRVRVGFKRHVEHELDSVAHESTTNRCPAHSLSISLARSSTLYSQLGFRVLEASNGMEAVKMVARANHLLDREAAVGDGFRAVHSSMDEQPLAAVLLDLKMPLMNGWEACQQVGRGGLGQPGKDLGFTVFPWADWVFSR